ncbi:MAG: hypothetical protein M0035_18910 [Actinomycetota bacterium]|nr:hypothetical protein [Actinomycetota bacterium]
MAHAAKLRRHLGDGSASPDLLGGPLGGTGGEQAPGGGYAVIAKCPAPLFTG